MEERISIPTQNGPIRLEGDKYDSVLYLNNVPIQFTWIREIGTTWRYQIAKNIHESDIIDDRDFASFVRLGNLTAKKLAVQFQYIVSKLSSGDYLLEVEYLPKGIDLVEAKANQPDYYTADFYGGIVNYIETQATFDEQTVKEYIELIEQGVEPMMIILTCLHSYNKFILDGHHKYTAYNRLKKQPKALIITKLKCQKIDKEKGLALFNICACRNDEYRNRFLHKP